MYIAGQQCGVPAPFPAWMKEQPIRGQGLVGLGDCGCGCGGGCGQQGLGVFDSMDFTTWGFAEWAIIGVAAYTLLSFAGDTRRGYGRVRKVVRKRRRSARKKADLKQQLSQIP